jgi:prepilin-type N-terminal cleavage/methylation domain-containing protein
MKIILPKRRYAMTLVEVMVTTAIFSILMLGIIASSIFGLKMYGITQAKLGASDDARKALSKITDEIHSAWNVRIGNGSLSSFTELGIGSNQIGSAIQIYATSNTNDWVRYYYDSADTLLKRTEDGTNAASVMAHSIATNLIFSVEDYTGTILTNNYNNRVIGLNLQIKQFQYPVTVVGVGYYFDFYQLKTKITRRKIE